MTFPLKHLHFYDHIYWFFTIFLSSLLFSMTMVYWAVVIVVSEAAVLAPHPPRTNEGFLPPGQQQKKTKKPSQNKTGNSGSQLAAGFKQNWSEGLNNRGRSNTHSHWDVERSWNVEDTAEEKRVKLARREKRKDENEEAKKKRHWVCCPIPLGLLNRLSWPPLSF